MKAYLKHNKMTHGFRRGRYSCNQCSYVATEYNRIKSHYLSSKSHIFPCNDCDCSFSSIDVLNQHYESDHRDVTPQCKICEYLPEDLSKLHHHMEVEHNDHKCEYCEFATGYPISLSNHKMIKHVLSVLKRCVST